MREIYFIMSPNSNLTNLMIPVHTENHHYKEEHYSIPKNCWTFQTENGELYELTSDNKLVTVVTYTSKNIMHGFIDSNFFIALNDFVIQPQEKILVLYQLTQDVSYTQECLALFNISTDKALYIKKNTALTKIMSHSLIRNAITLLVDV